MRHTERLRRWYIKSLHALAPVLKIPPQGTVEHRPPSGIKPLFTVNLKLKYFVILTFLKIYSRAVCPLSLPIELACSVWGGEVMTIPVKFSLSNICVKYTGKLISRNGIFRDFMLAVKRVHVRTYIGTTCTQLSVHAAQQFLSIFAQPDCNCKGNYKIQFLWWVLYVNTVSSYVTKAWAQWAAQLSDRIIPWKQPKNKRWTEK